ncbi:SIMPL domain-containing protein [Sneathiella limimaris]|uniref:SIMPL domain-containing protein n=1 Tax=Sneathiella limimaris TaxID=1964213 RepID=UPI00146BDE9A|nr:SIMPL domain-containing protein [Sneathiella limimaris]
MNRLLLSGAALLVLTNFAIADELRPVSDQVILSLAEEGWVTTETADVTVSFSIVQQNETADALKAEVLKTLDGLDKDSTWYVTSSRESKDQTGLNRWSISANARLKEGAIAGLHDKAEKLSRPGFRVTVNYVNFSPSLAETNALQSDLRAKIYAEAKKEAERLSAAIGGSAYRVETINFLPNYSPQPMPMHKDMAVQRLSASMESSGGGGAGGAKMPVSQKYTVQATVTLGRLVPIK